MTTDNYDFWMFDLDGTIVDIDPAYPSAVVSDVGDRLGVTFDEREADVLWYGFGGARETVLRRHGIDPDQFWETFHDVESPEGRANATYLYDDAERFLGELDGPVGLVTHCQPYLTGPVLDRLDIRDWFDTVVCCSEELGWKPDSTPVERAMADLGVGHNGHQGALVGDDADDIGAAWNAGLDAIHVERYDPNERGQCVLGDHRVAGLDDLV